MKKLILSFRAMKKLVLSFCAIEVAALGLAAVCIFCCSDPKVRDLGLEIAKISIQLTLITLFGGILVQEYNRKRERKADVNDFRKTIIRELVRSYADTKKARRILRAKCQPKTDGETKESIVVIPFSAYEKQLHDINDIQLRFEIIVHELETFEDAFSDAAALKETVEGMDKYLKKLVSEYEKLSETCANEPDQIQVSKLESLGKCIGRRGTEAQSEFGNEFTNRFREALRLIRNEGLKI